MISCHCGRIFAPAVFLGLKKLVSPFPDPRTEFRECSCGLAVRRQMPGAPTAPVKVTLDDIKQAYESDLNQGRRK